MPKANVPSDSQRVKSARAALAKMGIGPASHREAIALVRKTCHDAMTSHLRLAEFYSAIIAECDAHIRKGANR